MIGDQKNNLAKKIEHEICPYSQSYGFPSSDVWMQELDRKEGWAPKNWCFQNFSPELLRVPWTARKSNQSILKKNQLWIFIERIVAEGEVPILWPPDVNSLEKTLMLGKLEGKRSGGWQRVRSLDSITDLIDMNLSKLQETGGQRSLAFCSLWNFKELDTT